MKVNNNYNFYVNEEKERLLEGKDFKLVGFYEDKSMFAKFIGMKEPVYLINGKYYIVELIKYPLMDIINNLESTYKDLGNATYYVKQYLYDISYHISQEEFWEKEYGLNKREVSNFFEIEQISEDKIIRQDIICLESTSYIGAIKLPNGEVVIGDEKFIKNVIIENVSDIKDKYKLLDTLYTNFQDYHQRDELINDIYNNHFEELSLEDQNKITEQKELNDFLIYGLNIMEDIKKAYGRIRKQ